MSSDAPRNRGPLMILPGEISWWYWAATSVLLIAWLAGHAEGFWLAAALTGVQLAHFRLREGSFMAFPVQVRLAYAGILALVAWEPMHWLLWIPAVGTAAQVLVGYCALARALSLLPWNRREPLTWDLAWRTFASPPRRGNILQGQPAVQELSTSLSSGSAPAAQ